MPWISKVSLEALLDAKDCKINALQSELDRRDRDLSDAKAEIGKLRGELMTVMSDLISRLAEKVGEKPRPEVPVENHEEQPLSIEEMREQERERVNAAERDMAPDMFWHDINYRDQVLSLRMGSIEADEIVRRATELRGIVEVTEQFVPLPNDFGAFLGLLTRQQWGGDRDSLVHRAF